MLVLVLEHATGDVVAEHLDLFSDVSEERVARPTPDDHNGVDRDMGEVHCHSRAGPEGVSAHVLGFETEFGFAQNRGCGTNAHADVVAGEGGESAR
eukprot:scaffold40616_cov59-Attheya_sp.AAC.1